MADDEETKLHIPEDDRDEFQNLLDDLYKDYQDNITNMTDAATDAIETAVNRGQYDLEEIVREYTDIASQLADDYYHRVRQTWSKHAGVPLPALERYGLTDVDRVLWATRGGFAGADWNGLKYRDVKNGRNRAGITMRDLWPDMSNPDDAQQFISDMMRNALRLQTQRNVRLDPSNPRWARVPQGKTCAFCTMLASRGFAYTSEEAAGGEGNAFHADCDCRIIPTWGEQTLPNYDWRKYEQWYEEAKEAAGGRGASYRDSLREMRRLHPGEFRDGVAPKPDIPWDYERIRPSEDELRRLGDYEAAMPGDKYSTEAKVEALRDWTGMAYSHVNKYLFGNGPALPDTLPLIRRIDEAIGDHTTQQKFTVFRDMDIRTFEADTMEDLFKLRKGQAFTHKGYMAARAIDGRSDAGGGIRVRTLILVTPGDHAVYLEPITYAPKEEEILIGRNRQIAVEKVSKLDGECIVYLRLVN